MVTVRLARGGAKKSPFYQIVVARTSSARDGRFIEKLGFFNPQAKSHEEEFRINLERVQHWEEVGAVFSGRVQTLIKKAKKTI